MEPVIELRNAGATRGGWEVVTEASFALREGRTAVFMGSAGSGKSSLLKLAAGILPADSGEVRWRGRDLARLSRAEELEFRRRSGFVFQDAALWANQSLFDNLALPVRLHRPKAGKAEVAEAVRRAADLAGYSQDLQARPAELSSGERRLVGLARALVLDPELIFMDEPANWLDEESAERVLLLVDDLRARGRTILMTSGSSEIAYRVADEVGVLGGGRILAYGAYTDAAGWGDPRVRAVIGRLRSRAPRRSAASALGAWESAMSGEPPPARRDGTEGSGAEGGE